MYSIWIAVVGALVTAPNLVLISVDTLRADRLGFYGYERPTSPNLDRLAAESLVFDDCLCEVPITNPSFGAMMTSQFPRTTGTTRNGLKMPEQVPTVAEQFQQAGYFTFCVQSNWTLKRKLSGLDRGFEVYDDDFHTGRWGVFKAERYADEVTRRAVKLLEHRDTSKPFFCWIHYSDPHAPYRFHRQFNPDGAPHRLRNHVDEVRMKYDSEVAFTDYHIGELLKHLPEEDTYIVFVADHGESLYEHDYLGHGRRIYHTELRIPLFIHGPDITPRRTSVPARGIDIGPTLLRLAKLSVPPSMLGLDLLSPDLPQERVRIVETYGGAVPHIPGARSIMAGRPPMRQGVVWNGWKLILGGPRTELYHLADDPCETKNLANEQPERVHELSKWIGDWDRRTPRGKALEVELSPDDIDALKAGGYL